MQRFYYILTLVIILTMGLENPWMMAEGVDIHGFISQGFLITDKNNYLAETDEGSFEFNEMGINFKTAVSDRLSIGCQFFARDLGSVGNDKIGINWAFSEYVFKNWLSLRVGIIKKPFGLYNDLRDFDSLRASIFLPSSVYNEWLRDGIDKLKGIELYGTVFMDPFGYLEYQLQYGESSMSLDSGIAQFLTTAGGFDRLTKSEPSKESSSRLIWNTPLNGLRLSGTVSASESSYEGIISIANNDILIRIENSNSYFFAYSAEYILGRFKACAEATKTLSDISIISDTYSDEMNVDEGDTYYANVGYQFTSWFEAAFYHSKYSAPENFVGVKEELKDNCLSLRFDINPSWITKIEVHSMDGIYGVFPDDNGKTYRDWMFYAAKLSYSF